MVKRMLVDATHPEETRVVVVNGTKLDEFDFETSTKKQLKGNIYLAKVIRIEPSLQAAFVEYGGNRHGFLAFSEIHPDYYQIPVADREAILAEQERRARQAEEGEGQERPQRRRGRGRGRGRSSEARPEEPSALAEADATDSLIAPDTAIAPDDQPVIETWDHEAAQAGAYKANENGDAFEPEADRQSELKDVTRDEGEQDDTDTNGERQRLDPEGDFRDQEADDETADTDGDSDTYAAERQDWPATYSGSEDSGAPEVEVATDRDESAAPSEPGENSDQVASAAVEGGLYSDRDEANPPTPDDSAEQASEQPAATEVVETVGGEDLGEEDRPKRPPPLRQYKIQEVIKRRQILLIQVVKEERGNKGAALTTYLSLAGRYCVLMPNAGRGGGISRKITNTADRKRMREMLSELEVPQGMGVILRTAGLERTKPEIKRDYDYLIRLWDSIRDLTLKSTAPALIYEEGNLIKRSIRDLYGKDIEDLLIEGEEAYRSAKDFMRQLMPSHAKKVQLYRDPIPLFHRYQVETQLDAMHSPVVQLKSGAYIVINPTEALVAIDVNSGRATKERNIEETALRTNVEAAEEIARQLRLRDLAGLIVIDFIDMEDQRHQVQVERRLKEAMRSDRARIQIGRISAFGLLELSRQRLRPSLLETSTEICPHCEGTGRIRSTESTALHVLRAIEEEGIRRRAAEIRITVPTHVALYLLNQKRAVLAEIETRYGIRVLVDGDDSLIPPNFNLERSRNRPPEALLPAASLATAEYDELDSAEEEGTDESEAADESSELQNDESAADGAGRRKRRRRRRRREDEGEEASVEAGAQSDEMTADASEAATGDAGEFGELDAPDASEESALGVRVDAEAGDAADGEGDGQARRRRRGRRGGRRRRQGDRPDGEREEIVASQSMSEPHVETTYNGDLPDSEFYGAANDHAARPRDSVATGGAQTVQDVTPPMSPINVDVPSVGPDRPMDAIIGAAEDSAIADKTPAAAEAVPPAPEPAGPPRRGWWQRLTSSS